MDKKVQMKNDYLKSWRNFRGVKKNRKKKKKKNWANTSNVFFLLARQSIYLAPFPPLTQPLYFHGNIL